MRNHMPDEPELTPEEKARIDAIWENMKVFWQTVFCVAVVWAAYWSLAKLISNLKG